MESVTSIKGQKEIACVIWPRNSYCDIEMNSGTIKDGKIYKRLVDRFQEANPVKVNRL